VSRSSSLRRIFGTPKGLLIIILAVLTVAATTAAGTRLVLPAVAASVLAAGLLDAVILRLKTKAWEFPDGAILTGLIVAMILSLREPWYVPACTSLIAIVSKHAFRTRFANVFNPAALALVIAFYVFGTAQDWWGALGELAPIALLVVVATGVFIADRVNKMPLVLVFLAVYFLLFTIMAFLGDPGKVAEIFRAPDLHAALYFAFFILTDPPTSPVKYAHQVPYAVMVAVASFAVFESVGAAHYLLAGVLVGNVWEAWRRNRTSPQRHRETQRNAENPGSY
jgi:Na+-translocating ferredoxin:NAD+ oxidoreductase RnfD subunit